MPITPIGGGIDGPNYADYYDTADANQILAASTNLRNVLHLVKNTDVLFITEMGGQLRTYNAQPNNPTLMPIVTLRKSPFVSTNFTDQDVEARFQNFMKTLPHQLRMALQADMGKPASQRSEKLTAFEGVLRDMAELSLWATNFNEMNVGAVNEPTGIALFRMLTASTNGVKALDHTYNKVKAEHARMPEIDPNRVVLGEFLNMLAKLISAAKAFLQEMQTTDAEAEKGYSIAQREGAASKLSKELEMFTKAATAKAKKATMDLVMKITGPIIAVLALVATVLSGGTLLALFIALATTALSIADSVTGFMTEGIQKALDKMSSPLREIVAAALIIVILVVAKKVGTLGSAMIKKATEEATKKATESAAKMAAMQLGMTLIATSGVLTTTCTGIAKACFKKEDDAEIAAMVMQLILMLGLALACGKYMGNIDTTKASMLCDILSDSLATGTKVYSAVTHVKLGILAKEKYDIQASITLLETALELFGLSKKEIAAARKQLNELSQLWSDLFNTIIQKGMQINTALAQAG